jgi:nitrite reductase/ring-hydroxylating ferredoxin subunit
MSPRTPIGHDLLEQIASLADGELLDGCVECPLHSSRFALEDGSVERGPAAYPQPALEARVRDGSIEVRGPQRP